MGCWVSCNPKNDGWGDDDGDCDAALYIPDRYMLSCLNFTCPCVLHLHFGLCSHLLLLLHIAGLAWASVELISYLLIRPYFIRLMERNPRLAGQTKKQDRTATLALPRVVCFVHNIIQVPTMAGAAGRRQQAGNKSKPCAACPDERRARQQLAASLQSSTLSAWE